MTKAAHIMEKLSTSRRLLGKAYWPKKVKKAKPNDSRSAELKLKQDFNWTDKDIATQKSSDFNDLDSVYEMIKVMVTSRKK